MERFDSQKGGSGKGNVTEVRVLASGKRRRDPAEVRREEGGKKATRTLSSGLGIRKERQRRKMTYCKRRR